MKRFGRSIRWNERSILGFSAVMLLILVATEVPNYYSVWLWGPDTGYRSAGLRSGHYERQFPAIRQGMPLIGQVLVSGGTRLVVDYDLTIDAGKAAFSVWKWPSIGNHPRRVGPRLIAASEADRIEVTLRDGGLYRIFMYAHSLQGTVAVDWRTEDTRTHAGLAREG